MTIIPSICGCLALHAPVRPRGLTVVRCLYQYRGQSICSNWSWMELAARICHVIAGGISALVRKLAVLTVLVGENLESVACVSCCPTTAARISRCAVTGSTLLQPLIPPSLPKKLHLANHLPGGGGGGSSSIMHAFSSMLVHFPLVPAWLCFRCWRK